MHVFWKWFIVGTIKWVGLSLDNLLAVFRQCLGSHWAVFRNWNDTFSVNCEWSNWRSYSSCSKSCGGGIQSRSRSKTIKEAYGGSCSGSGTMTKDCNTQKCPSKYIFMFLIFWVNTLRFSKCPLGFGCWELSHVIFLMLRKKELLAKLSKFISWQLFSLKFTWFVFLKAWENHLTQLATAKN